MLRIVSITESSFTPAAVTPDFSIVPSCGKNLLHVVLDEVAHFVIGHVTTARSGDAFIWAADETGAIVMRTPLAGAKTIARAMYFLEEKAEQLTALRDKAFQAIEASRQATAAMRGEESAE